MQDDTTPCPAPVYHKLEMDHRVRRPLKRTYAVAGKSKKIDETTDNDVQEQI